MSLPAKMRRLALVGALSVKAIAKSIKIVDGADKANGKTKQLEWLDEGTKTLVVAGSGQDKFKQGIRNLQRMSITQAKSLSTYAILANRQLIITTEALEEIKRDMLIKAIISEKALKEARNKRYTFVVAVKATKTQIKNGSKNVWRCRATSVDHDHARQG